VSPRRVPLFWSSAAALVVVWALLEWGVPYFAMWVTGGARPLPVPDVVRVIYVLLALVGVLVYASVTDESLEELVRPVRQALRGPAPGARNRRLLAAARLALLAAVPLLGGGVVWGWTAPRAQSPTVLRIQHPTIPGAYERLRNPFREPGEAALKKWIDERKFAGSVEDARRAYGEAALAEGRTIFQINCRPCHGDAADGAGPMAWGFRLKPANFTDPGTIATVVEAYPFWRVTEGGPGLPPEATPWDSAMPIWKSDLTDEQKWKAIMAAYDLAGVEPRKPEKLEARGSGPALGAVPPSPRAAEAAWGPPAAWAQGRPLETPENIARGKAIYAKRCAACHGDEGDGRGPVAPYLDPRPRDFVLASFKFRTTQSGERPTDEDLFRVLTRGVPGTAMPAWTTLSAEERWLVIGYIKTFSDVFKDKFTVVAPATEVAPSPAVVARGKEVYQRAKCWECHGQAGRGDGPAAPTLKDDAGDAMQAADLTKGWRIKGGREARDIFMRFSTGLDGTPMPSFADSLPEADRWALAHYVRSLQTPEEPGEPVVLRASRMAGDLPTDPEDPRWQGTPFLAVPLAGQVIAKPRWQNHSVDAVTLRAYYNDAAIAFLVEWNDRFKDVVHRPGAEPALEASTYPLRDLRATRDEKLRDAVRLQFPSRPGAGTERPHFFLGNPGRPVVLWHWQADRSGAGERAVVTERAEGFQRPIQVLPEAAQQVTGRGVWKDGRWKVVMTRPRLPADAARDLGFEPGRLIPLAVQVWDGANGEKGLMMSLSSWNYVTLEAPVPASAYASSLLAIAVIGLFEGWLIRRARPAARPRQ
jgi:DMSO reductase family type II enzyme heme b subunit